MEQLEVDLHTHLIPGVDDGSRGAVETIAMARGLADLGVRRIHLTPHQFRFGNAFTSEELDRKTGEVANLLERALVDVEVVRGAEYFFGERFLDALQGGEEWITFDHEGEACILVELSTETPCVGVRRVARALRTEGVRPVLAHPERCAAYLRDLSRVRAWCEAGWLLQLDLPSLVGVHGEEARILAGRLLEEGLYEFFGSDIHRPFELPQLRAAHERIRSATGREAIA